MDRFQETVRNAFKDGNKSSSRRKVANEHREKVGQLVGKITLYGKALDEFEADEDRTLLAKHILRDFGSPIVESLVWLKAESNCIPVQDDRPLDIEYRKEVSRQFSLDDAKTFEELETV